MTLAISRNGFISVSAVFVGVGVGVGNVSDELDNMSAVVKICKVVKLWATD